MIDYRLMMFLITHCSEFGLEKGNPQYKVESDLDMGINLNIPETDNGESFIYITLEEDSLSIVVCCEILEELSIKQKKRMPLLGKLRIENVGINWDDFISSLSYLSTVISEIEQDPEIKELLR